MQILCLIRDHFRGGARLSGQVGGFPGWCQFGFFQSRLGSGTMSSVSPRRQPEPGSPHRIYTLEATGVLIISLLILIVTLVRSWETINWSAR